MDHAITFSGTPVPDICQECGKDFPWRHRKLKIESVSKKNDNDPIFLVRLLCDRFHLVAKQVRQRYNERETIVINDEYDVQDLLHALLRIYFDDIRPEEWNPSYAGSSTRVDFLLKQEQVVIEVKKTRASLKTKQLGEQLLIDIAHYKNNPDCKTLYCFVYDPDGYINNPRGIEYDLSRKDEDFNVIVTLVPKGH